MVPQRPEKRKALGAVREYALFCEERGGPRPESGREDHLSGLKNMFDDGPKDFSHEKKEVYTEKEMCFGIGSSSRLQMTR